MQETSFRTKVDESILLRIVHHIILNVNTIEHLGLYRGRMGIVLFLYLYSRYSNKLNFEELAGELLNDICNEIHTGIDIDFANGLCGIGWSIEYLLDNNFLEGDSLNILEEIDTRIMEKNLLRINDMSIETGLSGISYYIHKHLNSTNKDFNKTPFDKTYIADWNTVAKQIIIPNDNHILLSIIAQTYNVNQFTKWKLGLENGCAGYGLKKILK